MRCIHFLLFAFSVGILPSCNQGSGAQRTPKTLHKPVETPKEKKPTGLMTNLLPQMSGVWRGTKSNSKHQISWIRSESKIQGIYTLKSKKHSADAMQYNFFYEANDLYVEPSCYQCKCGTPYGRYKVTAQTDSSYTFLYTVSSGTNTIQFDFDNHGGVRMSSTHHQNGSTDIKSSAFYVRE